MSSPPKLEIRNFELVGRIDDGAPAEMMLIVDRATGKLSGPLFERAVAERLAACEKERDEARAGYANWEEREEAKAAQREAEKERDAADQQVRDLAVVLASAENALDSARSRYRAARKAWARQRKTLRETLAIAHVANMQADRMEKERDEFKRLGQGFERDSRTFFDQSCRNLARYMAARKAWARLRHYSRLLRDEVRAHDKLKREVDAAQAELAAIRPPPGSIVLPLAAWEQRTREWSEATAEVERLKADLKQALEVGLRQCGRADAAEAREAKLRETLERIARRAEAQPVFVEHVARFDLETIAKEARAALSPEKTIEPDHEDGCPGCDWCWGSREPSPPEKAIRHPAHCGCLRCAKDIEDAFGLNDEPSSPERAPSKVCVCPDPSLHLELAKASGNLEINPANCVEPSPPETAQRQQGAYLSTDRDAAVGENWDAIRTMSRPNNPPEKAQAGEVCPSCLKDCAVHFTLDDLAARDQQIEDETFEEAAVLVVSLRSCDHGPDLARCSKCGALRDIASAIRAKKGTR